MGQKRSEEKRISPAAFKRIAAEFKILADPTRLQILNELRGGEKNVTQLVRGTEAPQSNVSKHLAILHSAGFLARRKQGLQVFYSICDPTVHQLCDLMCSKFKLHFEKESQSSPGQNRRNGRN